jgi:protein tyrosine/serine phosphatase
VQRWWSFSAVFNFRDLGGHAGMDGRTVRWGRLYRSDSLSRLCDADREAFTALGIRTVLDLRRPYEVERDGVCPQWTGTAWHHVHPEHPEWDPALFDETAGTARFLADRYHELAEVGADGLARALGVIADADAAPTVVHCLAGKDRTGVVCALTLALLGVSDVDIAADYTLTQESAAKFRAWLAATQPRVAAQMPAFYLETPPEAMLLFLTELRERHGGVEEYVTRAGLRRAQIAALRAHLLG